MNKKAQKRGGIAAFLIIIGIIALAIYLISINAKGEEFIEVNLYDEDGNLISDSGLFSTVQGTEGVAEIDFTINIDNIGERALTCDLLSATPSQLNTALPSTLINVPIGGSNSWTTSRIGVSQFEGLSQPVNFAVTVSCEYELGGVTQTIGPKTGSVDLTITPDATGDFSVTVGSAGTTGEGSGSGTVSDNVVFRTNSLTYTASNSAIAYGYGSCGDSLTKLGYNSQGTLRAGICGTNIPGVSTSVVYVMDVPGGWLAGGNGARLYRSLTSTNFVYICDDDGANSQYRNYYSGSSSGGTVDTSASAATSTMEVAC